MAQQTAEQRGISIQISRFPSRIPMTMEYMEQNLYARTLLKQLLPPLAESMDAALAGDWNRFEQRVVILRYAQAQPDFVREAWERMLAAGVKPIIIPFDSQTSTPDQMALLQDPVTLRRYGLRRPPELWRTVTVRYPTEDGGYRVLVSSLGQLQIGNNRKDPVNALMHDVFGFTNNKPPKNRTVNPPYIYPDLLGPTVLYGQDGDLIQPVLPADRFDNISALCYVHNDHVAPEDPIAMVVSPLEILVMPKYIEEETFLWYAQKHYPVAYALGAGGVDVYSAWDLRVKTEDQ